MKPKSGFVTRSRLDSKSIRHAEYIRVIPNPAQHDRVLFQSSLINSKIQIFNISGTRLHEGVITAPTYSWETNAPPGIYFIKYQIPSGGFKTIKFIKL